MSVHDAAIVLRKPTHAYDTSEQRRAELPAFLYRYNQQYPDGGINGTTPISHLSLTADNLLMFQS